jgi:hypothetical protein
MRNPHWCRLELPFSLTSLIYCYWTLLVRTNCQYNNGTMTVFPLRPQLFVYHVLFHPLNNSVNVPGVVGLLACRTRASFSYINESWSLIKKYQDILWKLRCSAVINQRLIPFKVGSFSTYLLVPLFLLCWKWLLNSVFGIANSFSIEFCSFVSTL